MDAAPQHLMNFASLPQILILLVVVLLLFGKGKVSEFMGDFAKGIKAFKKGLSDDDVPASPPAQPGAPQKPLEHEGLRADVKSQTGTETKA